MYTEENEIEFVGFRTDGNTWSYDGIKVNGIILEPGDCDEFVDEYFDVIADLGWKRFEFERGMIPVDDGYQYPGCNARWG